MLPWKVQQPIKQTVAGVEIPDYEGMLVNESEVLMSLSAMQADKKVSSTQATEVFVAYCLAFRLDQGTEAEVIFSHIQKGAVTDDLWEACDLLLPPQPRQMKVVNELFDLFCPKSKKKGDGKSEGNDQIGQTSSGDSKSTTPTTLSLVSKDSEDAQSA
jgi:hypothetical protein